MFYIDIIADGERVAGPESSEDENVAWDLFYDLEREAIYLSADSRDTEVSVRMYDGNNDITFETVYANGERIA